MPCGVALLGEEGGSPGAPCGAVLQGPRGSRARDGAQLGGRGAGPRVTTLAFVRGGPASGCSLVWGMEARGRAQGWAGGAALRQLQPLGHLFRGREAQGVG